MPRHGKKLPNPAIRDLGPSLRTQWEAARFRSVCNMYVATLVRRGEAREYARELLADVYDYAAVRVERMREKREEEARRRRDWALGMQHAALELGSRRVKPVPEEVSEAIKGLPAASSADHIREYHRGNLRIVTLRWALSGNTIHMPVWRNMSLKALYTKARVALGIEDDDRYRAATVRLLHPGTGDVAQRLLSGDESLNAFTWLDIRGREFEVLVTK